MSSKGHTSAILEEDAALLLAEIPNDLARFEGTRVLITGASGFLGSYLVDIFSALNRARSARPIAIVAADNFRAAAPERLAHLKNEPNVELHTMDVVEHIDWGHKFDWIIHCASIASPTFYRKFPLETIDVNVNGTWRMLELAQASGSQGMLYFSSSEVYGDPDPKSIPTSETYQGNVSFTGPRACYDESKRIGETLCISYHKQRGGLPKIVRPFNVYGPGQRLNDGRIIPDLMSAALKGGPIVLLSDGRPTRSFCYVRDFVRGSLAVLTRGAPAEPYNIGTAEEISMLKAAQVMADVGAREGKPIEIRFENSTDAQYLVDNPNRRCPDLTKVEQAIGYKPIVDFRAGLERTYRYYLAANKG
jgi:dTDP-glucose 4,6-dehydratase/UDP-glucuronate decarboxylase